MYTKQQRAIDAVNTSTDFLDMSCVFTLSTSGAALTLANILVKGEPVCADMTSLVTNATTAVPEQGVAPYNANAGPPLGVYQGATITNSSTTATSTVAIVVRRQGYGLVMAGGVTTTVNCGSVLAVAPSAQTVRSAVTLVPSFNVAIQSAVYYVGAAVATGSTTAVGSLLQTPGATTFSQVNAYINVLG